MDGSPPSSAPYHSDPLLHPHDWELLSASTASTLLTHSHVLGLGLGLTSPDPDHIRRPPASSNPNFPLFSSNVVADLPPFDVSEIAAMCSSTSGLEPFTEGWEPQFKIAGASVLKEDYYGRDQSQRRSTPKRASVSVEDPSLQATVTDKDQAGADSTSSRDLLKEGEEVIDDVQKKMKECVAAAKSIVCKKTESWYGRYSLRCNKSHMVWSVTIAASLLGVILIVRHTSNASRKISS